MSCTVGLLEHLVGMSRLKRTEAKVLYAGIQGGPAADPAAQDGFLDDTTPKGEI